MEPYDPLRQLAPGLHCVEGSLGRSPLGRRMTVVVAPDGSSAVHSAIRMAEADMAALEAVGRPAWILVPNAMHSVDAPWYAARYPDARVLVPKAALAHLARKVRVDGTFEEDWPSALGGVLQRATLAGTRMGEAVFCHRPSRTLILTDLLFNLGTDFSGLTRTLLRWNQAYGRFGATRLFRWYFLRDAQALRATLNVLVQWDYDRVIVGHGAVLESGGKGAVADALSFLRQ